MRRVAASVSGIAILAAAVSAALLWRAWNTPLANLDTPVDIQIEPGSSLYRVSDDLAAAGHLQQPRLFVLLARLQGASDDIKAGEYRLEPGLTPLRLLRRMVAGDTIQYRVTIVEGWTFRQALATVRAAPKINKTPLPDEMTDKELYEWLSSSLAEISSPSPSFPRKRESSTELVNSAFILDSRLRGNDGDMHDDSDRNDGDMNSGGDGNAINDSLEGLIFPDTYFFTAGTRDVEILQRAHARLQAVLAEEWEGRYGGLPLADPYEALVLASIVEKESGAAAERGAIAGVFINRLELGMRLQSDPTVLYGKNLGKAQAFEGNLTRQDLETQAPYNTYTIDGLPPTPIALTSRAAIRAALRPDPVPYLYFVSRGDGSHQFSITLEEHNAAVDLYQRRRPVPR